MTGLSLDTLRAWEKRYRVVQPDRSSGSRLYADSDVHRLIRLRSLVAKGYSIGQVAASSDAELDNLERAHRPASSRNKAPQLDSRVAAAVEAVREFDNAWLAEELGRQAALLNPSDFVHQIALPLMRKVGECWHEGTMRASHEHLVTTNIRSILGAMARLNRPRGNFSGILLTTPTEEPHEVGVLAAAMLAAARGFHVTCLGPNLPADEILFVANRIEPQIIVLGMTSPEQSPAAIETVREIARALPPVTELWLGGAGAIHAMPPESSRPGIVLIEDFLALELNFARVESTARAA
jgi:DNA-binding transcriptional MerR regulator